MTVKHELPPETGDMLDDEAFAVHGEWADPNLLNGPDMHPNGAPENGDAATIDGTELDPEPVYPSAADYVPKHADNDRKPKHRQHEPKHTESDGKTGNEYEANDENLTALKGEAGVKVMEEMNDIIRQADREKRTLTKDEQSMLSLVVAAMDANDLGKEKGSRGGVIYNLRDRNQAYADLSKRRDNAPTTEQLKSALEDISDLEGDKGVEAINEANKIITYSTNADRPFTVADQIKIARANAAMEKYGLHSKLKWHQIDRLRKTDERLAKDQDRGEDELTDLVGKDGLKAMGALNQAIKQAEQTRRPLTDTEKTKLSRIIAAMDKFGLDSSDETLDTLSDPLQRVADRLRSTYAREFPELADAEGKELVHVPGEPQKAKGLRQFVSQRWQETKENVKGWSRRKKIGVAAAALAVAGVLGYGTVANIEHQNERAETEEVEPGDTAPSYLEGLELGDPIQIPAAEAGSDAGDDDAAAEADGDQSAEQKTAGEEKEAHPHAEAAKRTVELAPNGDSIWKSSERFLLANGYKANNDSINKVTRAVMAEKGVDDAAAKNLPAGWTYTVPLEVLTELEQDDE